MHLVRGWHLLCRKENTIRVFARNLLRGNHRRNTFRILFRCLAWGSNPGFTSNKPTHCLVDYDAIIDINILYKISINYCAIKNVNCVKYSTVISMVSHFQLIFKNSNVNKRQKKWRVIIWRIIKFFFHIFLKENTLESKAFPTYIHT